MLAQIIFTLLVENIEEHAALLVTNLLVDLKILHTNSIMVIQVRKLMD